MPALHRMSWVPEAHHLSFLNLMPRSQSAWLCRFPGSSARRAWPHFPCGKGHAFPERSLCICALLELVLLSRACCEDYRPWSPCPSIPRQTRCSSPHSSMSPTPAKRWPRASCLWGWICGLGRPHTYMQCCLEWGAEERGVGGNSQVGVFSQPSWHGHILMLSSKKSDSSTFPSPFEDYNG